MHPPCEMMVESFLPAMRERVARKLHEEGYSQGRIASLLGVTQASVSLYLRSEPRSSAMLERLGISEDQAARCASLLTEDVKKSPVYAVNTLYSLWADALGRGALCAAHRTDHPELAQCEMCIALLGPAAAKKRKDGSPGEEEEEDAVEQVASAVKMVEGSWLFSRLMPEVSVNIAYAPAGARSVGEVVAVPGRIVKVNGLPRAFVRPAFGASTHVASVLLAVVAHSASRRAAMNTRYDSRLDAIVRRMKLNVLRVDGGARLLESLERSLRASGRDPVDAVVDPGGQGSEPGLYLFAGKPLEVVRMGLEIARSYADDYDD